jgi:hypothetical protein
MENRPLVSPKRRWKGVLERVLKKDDTAVWNELKWPRIGSSKRDNDKEIFDRMNGRQITN